MRLLVSLLSLLALGMASQMWDPLTAPLHSSHKWVPSVNTTQMHRSRNSNTNQVRLNETVSAPASLHPSASQSTDGPVKPPQGPCCDDLECGNPALPHYIDCDKALDCSVATCPLDPHKPIVGGRLVSLVDTDKDECKNRVPFGHMCTCTCRCVCLYPTGEVVWLEWPLLDYSV